MANGVERMHVIMIHALDKSFTHGGSAEAECQIRNIIHDVATTVQSTIPQQQMHSLVLIGGYGRGEGGVRERFGQQVPNNNLDFLLIGRDGSRRHFPAWQYQVDQCLEKLQRRHDVGIDFSVMSGRQLQRATCRVMWYDMRGGHRTVLGDPTFVQSLKQFRVDRIPTWDVHNLLVNRATLLLINDCMPDHPKDELLDHCRLRHRAKAVIGYGDALLFSHGQYHWSYAKKRNRMLELEPIPAEFRRLYAEASSFRFFPDQQPGKLLGCRTTVRRLCEQAHLTFESFRLKRSITDWNGYLELALRNGWREDLDSTKGCLRGLRNLMRGSHVAMGQTGISRMGQRLLAAQRLLGLVSPAVLYDSCPHDFRSRAANWLSADSWDGRDLRKSFLRCWGQVVDRNFGRALSRLGVSIENEKGAAR